MTPLRVVVAPDSFGGALDSVGVAAAIATGWRRGRPDDVIVVAPMADGGEGTLTAVAAALGERAVLRSAAVHDPLGRQVAADWLLVNEGRAAFIEMAAASGLARLAEAERSPASARVASTYGTGELVLAAVDAGVTSLVLGLGGSATTDGGAGMLSALGVRFLAAGGDELPPGGAGLSRLARIDHSGIDPRLAGLELVVASDVTNPLTGSGGAAAVYGPQKGADEAAVLELDAALVVMGAAIEAATGRAVADLPGSGAAGGTGAGLLGFTSATMRSGFSVVAQLAGLPAALAEADLVITGEGRAAEQPLAGKTAMGVAQLAAEAGVPVVLLCGALGPGAEVLETAGLFDLVQPIPDRPKLLPDAMADSERLLVNAAERLARVIGLGQRLA
ncbi:MAG: glycerate kinase [Chloroflexota bacterium]|nr:glycerate kinase [Chloroflexota bacterium]